MGEHENGFILFFDNIGSPVQNDLSTIAARNRNLLYAVNSCLERTICYN